MNRKFNPFPRKQREDIMNAIKNAEKERLWRCKKCGLLRSSKRPHKHDMPDPALEKRPKIKKEEKKDKKKGLLERLKEKLFG